jgi:plasmid stabilization system protein ParE
MKYKLIISTRAEQDRDRAFEWYRANYSNEFANRWCEGISNAVDSLRRNPLRCAKAHNRINFHSPCVSCSTENDGTNIVFSLQFWTTKW